MRFTKSVALALMLVVAAFGGQNAYATDTKQQTETDTETKAVAIMAPAESTIEPTVQTIEITVKSGDTLAAIASSHNTTVDAIMADNGLADANLIEPGQVLKITVDGQTEVSLADQYDQLRAAAEAFITPPEPVVVAQPVVTSVATTTSRSYSSAPVNSSSYYVGNGMWCTDYVHSMRPDVPIYGNAGYSWISAAQADGKATGTIPQAGAVAVMNGHVAYVNSVNADGTYVVSEMGWDYKAGNFNQRTVKPGTFGQFIY